MIAEDQADRVRQRTTAPTVDVGGPTLARLTGSQLATITANHPPADATDATAAIQAERARLAEWMPTNSKENSSWSNRHTLVRAATTAKPSTRPVRKYWTVTSHTVLLYVLFCFTHMYRT